MSKTVWHRLCMIKFIVPLTGLGFPVSDIHGVSFHLYCLWTVGCLSDPGHFDWGRRGLNLQQGLCVQKAGLGGHPVGIMRASGS